MQKHNTSDCRCWLFVLILAIGILLGCESDQQRLTSAQVDELIAMPADLQEERIEIGRQRDALESDRRDLASQRHVEPLVAIAIERSVMLLSCILPVLVVAFLVWPRPTPPDAQQVCDFLVDEATAAPQPPRIASSLRRRLTRSSETVSRRR